MASIFSCCIPKKKESGEANFSTYFNEIKNNDNLVKNKVDVVKGENFIYYENDDKPEEISNELNNIKQLSFVNPENKLSSNSQLKFKSEVSGIYSNQLSRLTFAALNSFPTEEINNNQIIEENSSNTNTNNLSNFQRNPLITQNIEKITDIEVQSSKILELIDIDGNAIQEKRLLINASGLIKGGFRNANDGFTFFGLSKKSRGVIVINDYVLNINSKYNIGTVFKIFYNRTDKKYYLSCDAVEDDMIILFIRISKAFKLFKKHIISLGEVHISCETDQNNNLKIDIVYGNEDVKSKTFSKGKDKTVRIGRGKDNEIVLENYVFSRVHTSFFYSIIDDSWHVQDGIEDKKSTNGTWLFLDWNYCIESKTFFRIGKNTLIVDYVE